MEKEAISKACEIAGGQAALGRIIGVAGAMVHQWVKGLRPIAAEHCPRIERATDGMVRCEQLRPDVDWGYLRATDCHPIAAEAATAATSAEPAPESDHENQREAA